MIIYDAASLTRRESKRAKLLASKKADKPTTNKDRNPIVDSSLSMQLLDLSGPRYAGDCRVHNPT